MNPRGRNTPATLSVREYISGESLNTRRTLNQQTDTQPPEDCSEAECGFVRFLYSRGSAWARTEHRSFTVAARMAFVRGSEETGHRSLTVAVRIALVRGSDEKEHRSLTVAARMAFVRGSDETEHRSLTVAARMAFVRGLDEMEHRSLTVAAQIALVRGSGLSNKTRWAWIFPAWNCWRGFCIVWGRLGGLGRHLCDVIDDLFLDDAVSDGELSHCPGTGQVGLVEHKVA